MTGFHQLLPDRQCEDTLTLNLILFWTVRPERPYITRYCGRGSDSVGHLPLRIMTNFLSAKTVGQDKIRERPNWYMGG
jgi:hypothetical protein